MSYYPVSMVQNAPPGSFVYADAHTLQPIGANLTSAAPTAAATAPSAPASTLSVPNAAAQVAAQLQQVAQMQQQQLQQQQGATIADPTKLAPPAPNPQEAQLSTQVPPSLAMAGSEVAAATNSSNASTPEQTVAAQSIADQATTQQQQQQSAQGPAISATTTTQSSASTATTAEVNLSYLRQTKLFCVPLPCPSQFEPSLAHICFSVKRNVLSVVFLFDF